MRDVERLLGVDTSLTDTDWSRRRCHPCQPTPYEALEAVAARLLPGMHVADCGCGAGRAVFYLAGEGFRVTGIELDARWFGLAQENLRRCARRHPEVAGRVGLIRGAAQDVDYAALEADAVLAGHGHGGVIRLRFVGGIIYIVNSNSKLPKRTH